jgi:hypothetical protein
MEDNLTYLKNFARVVGMITKNDTKFEGRYINLVNQISEIWGYLNSYGETSEDIPPLSFDPTMMLDVSRVFPAADAEERWVLAKIRKVIIKMLVKYRRKPEKLLKIVMIFTDQCSTCADSHEARVFDNHEKIEYAGIQMMFNTAEDFIKFLKGPVGRYANSEMNKYNNRTQLDEANRMPPQLDNGEYSQSEGQ